jgi:hypothetical protein
MQVLANTRVVMIISIITLYLGWKTKQKKEETAKKIWLFYAIQKKPSY